MLIKSLFAFFLMITGLAQAQTLTANPPTKPSYRLTGSATLASHFVERGLSQTKGDPGMQADFWFNLGSQFRLGVWGANVRYDDTPSTHFWMKASADIKVDFAEHVNMNIKYSENHYFKSNNRNGNNVMIHFDFWGYRILYDMISNWEGTNERATYAGFGKDTKIWTDWVWANEGGYIMPKADGVKGFFDIRTGLGTKAKDIMLMASATYTTATGHFKKEGELAFILSASAGF